MSQAATPQVTAVTLHQQSRVFELVYDNGEVHRIPIELMRVYSPSAEVQGHGKGQEILQTGMRLVTIEGLTPIGHYGLQPQFSDGHNTGIFSWAYLYELGAKQDELWQDYLGRLAAAGLDRDQPMPSKSGGQCSSH